MTTAQNKTRNNKRPSAATLDKELAAAMDQHGIKSNRALATLAGVDQSGLAKCRRASAPKEMNKDMGEKIARVLPGTAFAARWLDQEPTKPTAHDGLPAGYMMLTLDAITPSPLNPRGHFDGDEIAELASDIKRRGMLQNIVVNRRRKDNTPASFTHTPAEIIAGERRYRACMLLKENGQWPPKSIPEGLLLVRADVATKDEHRAAALVENMQRVELTPLEEAKAFAEIIKGGKLTAGTLATKIGKTKRFVNSRLTLLNLTPELKSQLNANEITVETARTLATKPAKTQAQAATSGVLPKPKKAAEPTKKKQPADTGQIDAFAPPAADQKKAPPAPFSFAGDASGAPSKQHAGKGDDKAPGDKQRTCLDDFTAAERRRMARAGFEGLYPHSELVFRGAELVGAELIVPETGQKVRLVAAPVQ